MRGRHELINLDPEGVLPEIDITSVFCRSSIPRGNDYIFDLVDFKRKTIDRWYVPFIVTKAAVQSIKDQMFPNGALPLNYQDVDRFFIEQFNTPHMAQLAPQGILFISMGVTENGFASVILDTLTGDIHLVQGKDVPRLHVSGGDFDTKYRKWYFTCWPPSNKNGNERGQDPAQFDLRAIDIETLEEEHVFTVVDRVSKSTGEVIDPIPRRHHHVSVSQDLRYAVVTSFNLIPVIPYPTVRPEADPEGYRQCHKAGMRLEKLVTMDLEKKSYWQTAIPIPVTGHVEFDLDDPHTFYASAHNIAPSTQGSVLEGPAAIYKVRIHDGRSEIIGSYSDRNFYRITQNNIFRYLGKVLLASSASPNKIIIIDCADMSLFRTVILHDCEEITVNDQGVVDPEYPFAAFSLSPSKDGRYLIFENASSFVVYDMEQDRILKERVSRQIPKGYAGEGHARVAGE
jgi:hypothetical protein